MALSIHLSCAVSFGHIVSWYIIYYDIINDYKLSPYFCKTKIHEYLRQMNLFIHFIQA